MININIAMLADELKTEVAKAQNNNDEYNSALLRLIASIDAIINQASPTAYTQLEALEIIGKEAGNLKKYW